MPHKPPFVFPDERPRFAALGERLHLARMRRRMSSAELAIEAGVSRSTIYKIETGDPGATLGSYFRVLAALGLEADIDKLADDDRKGSRLQDLALALRDRGRRRREALAIIGPIDCDLD